MTRVIPSIFGSTKKARTSGQSPATGLSLRANFSWTFIGNVINAGAWFLMTVVLAQLGSPEDVGLYCAATVVVT